LTFLLLLLRLGLNLGLVLAKKVFCCLSNTSDPFCSSYFGDGASWTICPDWSWTVILPISSSQIARIAGMSHSCLA
jgi:hypothetical protein